MNTSSTETDDYALTLAVMYFSSALAMLFGFYLKDIYSMLAWLPFGPSGVLWAAVVWLLAGVVMMVVVYPNGDDEIELSAEVDHEQA